MRTLQRSFAGGIITPELYGRIDLAKFQTGLAECSNMIILPHGPATKRPGFEYVWAAKNASKAARLIPFSYSTTQTYAIEFGDQYVRFYTEGGILLSAGVPYEVATPYLEADLFDLHFVQSADVLTIVHPSYAPRELRRLGATSWTLSTITFAPAISAPTGVTATATVGSGTTTYTYVVTAVSSDGLEESIASSSSNCTNDLTTAGNYNTVTWTNVSGAIRYNVYKERSGLYGYVGQGSDGGSGFKDDNISPDTTVTPPESQNPFSGAGNYPGAVSYFEQRRCFAGTTNKPQNLWLTRSGTESNMNYSIPSQDNDAIVVKVAAREANTIRHLVPLSELIMLTSGGEWKCSGGTDVALAPTTIQVKPQSYQGANNVQPVVTGNSVLYAQDRGARIRELSYSWEASSYKTLDASIMAPHLFDGYTIVDLAYMRSPYQVLWVVRSDGVLLGLTYVPDQQVIAWHQHEADGFIESVCVIAEDDEDALYAVIRRTINGSTVRYVERLHSRQFGAQSDAFVVDSGLTYSGAATTAISGLSHLEGETVSALADGAVVKNLTVTGGAITLPVAASKVQVGLPITATLRTLPLALEIPGYGQGRVKNVSSVFMRVYRSSDIFAGPDENSLREYRQRTDEDYGSPPALRSDEIEIVLSNDWTTSGQVLVKHVDPTPLTLVSIALDVAVGG